jgi:hypothetical protein
MFTKTRTPISRLLSALVITALLLIESAAAGSSIHPALAASSNAPACSGLSGAAGAETCPLNQAQPGSGHLVPFGGAVTLSQTFTPSLRGPVCAVKVRIRRLTTAGAAPIKLQVLNANNAVMDSAIVPAPPLGDSIQTFSMGCDGILLLPGQIYRLKLLSPGSLAGTYAWWDLAGNPYPRGVGAGANWDYTFWVFLCPR